MENASKALIIAGGILLAMMILTMVISVGTSISDFEDNQDKTTLVKQIEEFNNSYLAYNKTIMYGTDVITVVNKAINHNKTIGATTTDPYYININIKTNQTFETTYTKIENNIEKKITDKNEIKDKFGSNSSPTFLGNEIYSLGTWENNKATFIMSNNFIQLFSGDTNDKTIQDKNIKYIRKSALTNFKTALFKCESDEIQYNEEGRIESMTFTQI